IVLHPDLHGSLLAAYLEARRRAGANKLTESAQRWRRASAEAQERGDSLRAAWFLTRAADALGEAQTWAEADLMYEEALRRLEADAKAGYAAQVARDWGETLRKRNESARMEEAYRRALTLD